MRIKKVSQTTPTQAQVVDGYSTSTTDSYSCNYVNEHSVTISATEPVIDKSKVWLQHSDNLFDRNSTLTEGYLTADGSIATGSSSSVCDYIDIDGMTSITISNNVGGNYRIAFYGGDKTFIEAPVISADPYTITIPSNAVYIRMTIFNSQINVVKIEEGSNVISDKQYILNNNIYEEFKPQNAKTYNGNEVIQLNSGYTLLSSYIFKLSNVYFVNAVVKKDSGYWTNTQENIGSLLKPIGTNLNSGCFISQDEWYTQFVGYMHIGRNGVINIQDKENRNCNIAKLKFSYVSTD